MSLGSWRFKSSLGHSMFIDTYVTRAKRLLGRMLSTALLTAVACSTPDRVAFDFAANLDLATIHPETRSVDVGLAKLRHHLNRGSEDGETRTDGRTFAWGLWPESTLEFYTFDPRPAAIRFRARPSDPMAGTEPRLEVVINGHDIAAISLRPGFNNYRVKNTLNVSKWGIDRHHRRVNPLLNTKFCLISDP